MRVFIGAGHGGFKAKQKIKEILNDLDCEVIDVGSLEFVKTDDYPDFAKKVCRKVLHNKDSFGILICGSGTGMQIAANKFKGIRAAFCYDEYGAKMARYDNDCNVLTLREREFDDKRYFKIVKTFLETDFSREERHIKRILKLEQ